MGRLGVVLGSNAIGPGGERVLAAVSAGRAAVVQRHGAGEEFRLPHRIDHAANLRSLLEAGCDRVLAIGSVGSLKEGIGVGSLVCPDDFIALQLGTTTFEDARGHSTPGFDAAWRERVLWVSEAVEGLLAGGVYWETIGPRFETPAEISMIAAHADIVGMTIASECVIAGELGLPYAALCVVDNLANGIGGELSPAELEAQRAQNAERLAEALEALLPGLERGGSPMSLTVTGARLDGETVGVRCVDGRIEALGAEVAAEPGDETIDAAGAPLVAGLVNGHTHAAMTLFRGYGGDLPLMRWLREKIWPVEARLEPEDVYWGTRLACVEMIRTGTTRFWDMYWHPEATARAVRDAGLAATVGGPLFDAEGGTKEMQASAIESLDALAAHSGARVTPSLAPHSIYTVSRELLRWTAETAGERGVAIQIHLSETEQEVEECVEAHGVRPAHYLDQVGLLGERTVLAHGVWLDRGELELIAERGATVVANPVANMKLAVGGLLPYPAAREAGVAVGLGTDGAGSNDSLDLLADLKVFALTQRHLSGDPTVLPAPEAWAIATGGASALLGGGPRLEAGSPADFLLLRRDSHELGLGDLYSNLVYAASGSIVDTTVAAGRVLMRGGEVEGAGEALAAAAERARRLGLA